MSKRKKQVEPLSLQCQTFLACIHLFSDKELETVSVCLKREKKKRQKIVKLDSIPQEVLKHFVFETNGFGHITIMRWKDREHIPHQVKLMPPRNIFRQTVHGKCVDYVMKPKNLVKLLGHEALHIAFDTRALAVKYLFEKK